MAWPALLRPAAGAGAHAAAARVCRPQAELKHGRVCMLGIVGWLANDAGLKVPNSPQLEGVSSLEAHDVTAQTGHLWALLFCVGVCEYARARASPRRLPRAPRPPR